MLVLKLLLTPSLITLSYFVGKWFGQRAAGLAAAFPLVVGPILLFINIEQGPDFGRIAIGQALAGALGLGLFTWVFAWVSRLPLLKRGALSVVFIILIGWTSFVALWFIMSLLKLNWPILAVLALGFNFVMFLTLPRLKYFEWPQKNRRVITELVFRLVFSSLLVLGLTGFAHVIGPEASGVFAPFPVAGSVVMVAAFVSGGPSVVREVANGFMQGIFGIVTFLIVWILTFEALGLGGAFCLALAAAFGLQALILMRVKNKIQ